VRAERFEVEQDTTAVPIARRAVVSALHGHVPDEVVDAAELVVSELTGNALLHAVAPISLVVRLGATAGSARVEVHDGSRTQPVRARSGGPQESEGLTGRGLGLIDAVAAQWGVEPTSSGKAVWAELTPESVTAAEPTEADLESLLAGDDDWPEPESEPRIEVTLEDVPTDLLLAAKVHVDSVVREIALTSTGAESGVSAALPPHLSGLVDDISLAWAEARQAIKRQAVAAAERGEPRTTLRLSLPASAAEEGERYLAALEQADAYGRASRLLTLGAPPQQRAFHRWYVTSFVEGLRSAAAGQPAVARSFEDHLLLEIEHLATLQLVSERSARLQRASAALSGALNPAAVAETVLAEAVADLGALRGVLLVPDETGARPAASIGYPPELLAAAAHAWTDRRRTPAARAWASGTAVWAEAELDRAELADAALEPDAGAACAVPLQVGGQLVGLLSLTFRDSRLFSDDERAFLRALAAVAAQALERAHLHERQAEVAERLIRLQAVTTALAAAADLEEVLDVAIEHATGLVGAWQAALCLLRPDGRTIELCRMVPFLGPDHDGWATFDITDDVPAAEAIRTGGIAYASTVAERDARWPAIAKYARDVEHSMVVLPLHGEVGTIGAISLSFPSDRGRPPDRSLLQAFVDACAQAVERTRAAQQARTANRRLAFLVRASAELSSSLDVERTLAGIARLAVPEVGDWCVVHLLHEGELRALAVEHADPAKTELAWSVQRRWPSRLSDPAGVAEVVRSGEPLLVPDIPALMAQMRAAGMPAQRDPEHEALLQGLGLQSALIVPLEARGRTLGALTFITAESERRYDQSDLGFTLDLARRAAVALDNARLFSAATARAAAELPAAVPKDTLEAVLAAAEVGRFAVHLAEPRLESDERLASFFGFQPDDPEADLQGFLARVHPDDLTQVQAAVLGAVEQVGDFAVEHRVVLPSGAVRWVALRGSALPDAAGGSDRVVGVAYDSTTARDVRDRTARLVETMGDAFFRVDRDWLFAYVNGQAEKLLFRGREELLGQSLWEEFPDLLGTDFETRYRSAMQSGVQTSFEAWFGPLDLWLEVRATPDPDGLSVFFHDVTVRRRAEQERQEAAARLALLADATRELVGALDAAEVLDRVVQVLVPALGEWAIAGLVDDEGRLRDARAVHADPALSAEVDALVRARPYALESVPRVARVLASGAGELAPAMLPRPPGVDDEVALLVERLGYGSALVVPLVAGDATLGIICVLSGTGQPVFTADDLATAGDIGRRAGLAVQNAQLFARQRTAVEVLQRSMLSALPQPAGLELVARYRAAGQEAQVGGDWYDAFLQPDGATVLVIGDVIGHDMGAAAAMGQLRSLLRGTTYDRQESPARVLTRVDSALRGLQIDTLATALVARLEQSPQQREQGLRTLRWSSAGHPPAVLVAADGTPRLLDVDDDLLLGFDDSAERHDHVIEIAGGDTLLLFTDGLVERRDSDLTDGIERLRVALSELADRPLDQLCDALLERLLPAQADDDVALVALRVLPVGSQAAAAPGAASVPVSRSGGSVPSTSA
jgi:GAF domain-containing protein